LKSGIVKVLLVDLVLVVFAYFVLQDLAWRDSYAASRGYSAVTAFSLLTRRLDLKNGATSLVSPFTLDWIQVVIALLIIVNVAYVFGAVRGSRPSVKAE